MRRGRVSVEDVPAPLVEPGTVLVEVAWSLISAGTESATLSASGKPLLRRAIEEPARVGALLEHLRQRGLKRTIERVQTRMEAGHPSGYSCAGTIVQVGAGVVGFSPGEGVACAGSRWAHHAELVVVPRNLVAPVPQGCSLRSASSVTLGAIALQGVRRAAPALGETVAVLGLGLLGQLTVQMLRAAGANVIGFEPDDRRSRIAAHCGARSVHDPRTADIAAILQRWTAGRGVDSTIITAASAGNDIVQQAMLLTRKKGRVVVVGDVGLGLERSPFYEKELDLLISCSYGPGRYDPTYEEAGIDYPPAYVRWTENRNMAAYLELLANASIDLEPILEAEFEIDRASEALASLSGERRPLGVLLRYPERPDKGCRRLEVGPPSPVEGRIRLGVIGAGGFCQSVHLPHLRELGERVVLRTAVCRTPISAAAIAKRFGFERASTDPVEVFADPEIDAVLIATRHDAHADQALEALRAGKHVFLEKPMALTREDLGRLIDFYGDLNPAPGRPLLMTGFNRRFSPYARRIREILDGRPGPFVATYRVNAGHLPLDHWIHGPSGGGRNLGEACHFYDLFTSLGGQSVVEVDVLNAKASTSTARDNFVAGLRFADGSVATLAYTSLGPEALAKERIEVFVGGLAIVVDDFKDLSVFGSSERGLRTKSPEKGHRQELVAFFESLAEGQPWPIPFWEQVQATEIALTVEKLLE